MSTTTIRPKDKTSLKDKIKLYPRYHVILLNDEFHSYEYVMEMVMRLFRITTQELAYKIAQKVDKEGRAILATLEKEVAEFKQDQIHAYGKDFRIKGCKGSMTAVLEPER